MARGVGLAVGVRVGRLVGVAVAVPVGDRVGGGVAVVTGPAVSAASGEGGAGVSRRCTVQALVVKKMMNNRTENFFMMGSL
jgi:hypothetical protein